MVVMKTKYYISEETPSFWGCNNFFFGKKKGLQ